MVRTEVGKLGPFFLLSRRFWVNVKSHTASLVFFPQYLMTFFEKCAVIILVCHWDLERLKQSPNDTEIANRETSVYTQVWSLFGFSMKGWFKKKIVLSFLFLLLFSFVFGQIWCAFLFWAHTQIQRLIVLRSIPPDPSSALLQMAGALVPLGCSQTPTSLGSQLAAANRGALRGGWLTSLVPDSTWRLLPWTPAVHLLPLTLPPTHGSEFLQFWIPDWPSVPFGFSALLSPVKPIPYVQFLPFMTLRPDSASLAWTWLIQRWTHLRPRQDHLRKTQEQSQ